MKHRVKFAKKSACALLAAVTLLAGSCSKDNPVTEVPSLGADTTGLPVTEVIPEVDYSEGFRKLVEELSPVAAWDCEQNEEGKVVEYLSGTEAKLENATVVDGYSNGGIETLSTKNSYLNVGTGTVNKLINGKSALTVSMWIMPYVNYNNTFRLISIPIDGGKGALHVNFQSMKLTVGGRSTASEGFVNKTYEYKLENNTLGTMATYSNEGQWQHVVMMLDFEKDSIVVYINGTKLTGTGAEAFVSTTYQAGNPSEPDCFGGSPQVNVFSYNGIMDNLFLFDRTLNAKEVRSLYAQDGINFSPIADDLLLQSAVKKLRQDPVFMPDATCYIQNGSVHPLDPGNTSAESISHGGELLIPAAAASLFASSAGVSPITVEGKSYYSVKALCEANGKTFTQFGDLAIALSSNSKLKLDEDAPLLDRIVRFFGEAAATRVFEPVELTRAVVAQTGTPSGVGHCASPSVVTLNGKIYASMDSNATQVYVFCSSDGGKTFDFLRMIQDFKFSSLFTVGNDLYLLGVEVDGTLRHAGITKSSDGGKTWSAVSRLPASGDGNATHASSTAVLIANGRVYKAYSGQGINGSSYSWRKSCTCYIQSAPLDADLLDPSVWTVSNPVYFDTNRYLAHPNASKIPTYVYCQEGNAVLAPDGKSVWAVYRVDSTPINDNVLILKLSDDCKTLTWEPKNPQSMIKFEGGITKCTIRYDATTGKYLALVNNVEDRRFLSQRNILSLAVSDDLVNWTTVKTLLTDRTVMNDYISLTRHAFQYVDWTIDGDDLLFTVREAMGDSENYHNANNLTFYRLENYRAFVN